MAELDQSDVVLTKAVNRLNELGYEQELERGLSFLGVLGLGIGLVCLPYTVYTVSAIVFTEGGSVDFIYGWALWGLLTFPIVLSMGEICSVFPIASGSYYWCYALAPPSQKRLASYVNGFLICIGLTLAVLATAFPMGQFCSTMVVLFHPDYIIPTWLPFSIFIGFLAVALVICSLGTVFLERFGRLGGIFVPVVTVILFIVPLAMSKDRHSVRFVLTSFESFSGWNNEAAFLIGLLGPGGVLTGFGFLTSLCEEVANPAVNVPQAMLVTQLVGVVAGIVFVFGTMITVPDGLSIASAQTGQAAYVILQAVMDTPGGALALMLVSLCTAVFLLVGTLSAGSRFIWAFARDGGLPGSKWLATVHPRLKIPFNAMLLIAVIDILLACISFGSSVAYNAFLGGCTIILLSAYAQPIIYNILDGRKSMDGAAWSLGRWGWFMNVVGILVCILGCILFSFPLTKPVTAVTMNWSIVIATGFAAIGLFYYGLHGRKVFRGPAVADNVNRIPDSAAGDNKDSVASAKVVEAGED